MVNFRFHLVSLTAVFLALAAGIAIGAGVVDRASVDLLEGQLERVKARSEAVNARNDRLEADLDKWSRFAEQAGDQVVTGRLTGIPVLFFAMQGIDRDPVQALRQASENAGAINRGIVWLTPKWRLAETGHVRDLATAIGHPLETRPDVVRRMAFDAIAQGITTGTAGTVLAALKDQAFIDFEAPAAPPVTLAELPVVGDRLVVVSGDKAAVPDDQVAVPLTAALTLVDDLDVLAAEVTPPPPGPGAKRAPTFVQQLRSSSDVGTRLSTVDTLQDYRARVAAVLALHQLGDDRTGHYGIGPGAQRLVPEPSP